MAIFGNNNPKHKKFGYTPRFYDPAKEALEQRLKPYQKEEGIDNTQLAKDRIRAGLRSKSGYAEGYRTQEVKKSNSTLFMVIGVLCILTYLVLSSNRFSSMLDSLVQ